MEKIPSEDISFSVLHYVTSQKKKVFATVDNFGFLTQLMTFIMFEAY